MCCLYGCYCYREPLNKKDMSGLITALGISATERGIDATGLTYVHNGSVVIQKAPKAAYDFKFTLPDKTPVVMGHTRMTTQGKAKNNYNNHPFGFKTGSISGALAHNGVIHNDTELRKIKDLPTTKIETDSYIAVQLMEIEKTINMETIKSICEQLEGSYCFTVLDDKNTLYLVKGNNPLYVIHHKKMHVYFYASTEQILWRGIVNSSLFAKHFKPYLTKSNSNLLKESPIEEVPIKEGQILKISNDGYLEYKNFTVREKLFNFRWLRNRSCHSVFEDSSSNQRTDECIGQLRWFATSMGLDEDIVDILLDEGFCYDEIEEFIYDEATAEHNNNQLSLSFE